MSRAAPASRRIGRCLLALLLSLAVPLVASAQGADAVPELIVITEAEAQTDNGAALARTQALYRESLGSDEEAALVHAKEMVALSVRQWGDTDPRVAQALTNLAIAQAQTDAFDLARENFRAAIRVHEVSDNSIIAPALINPLRGLASANVALNDLQRAVRAYERAIHISHVNFGPNNLEQVDVMDALSQAHYFLRDLDTATDIQENVYRLRRRQFDRDSDQYIDALLSRARWYRQTLDFNESARAYKQVEKLITDVHGADDVRLIDPLLELAFVALNKESTDNSAFMTPDPNEALFDESLRAASRAVRVARVNAAKDPLLLPTTLTKAGDWMVVADQRRKARLEYLEAWELANANPDLHAWRDLTYGTPVAVARSPLRTVHDRKFDDMTNVATVMPDLGFVEVGFSIDTLGRPTDVVVLDSDPPGLMDNYVAKQVKRFSYRPAIRDGRPVEFDGLRFRHDFRYNAERLSEKDREYIARVSEQRERESLTPDEPGPDSRD